MTFDQAMVKAASELDRHLERLNDESWLRMIASGMDEATAFNMMDQTREANAAAREQTLADISAMLLREFEQR